MRNPSLQNFNNVLDEMAAAVMVINRENGVIKYANDKLSQDLGKPLHEIKGKNFRHVFCPEFISVYYRILADCEDGQEHTSIYYWTEKVLWEQITAKAIDWNGEPAILLTILYVSEFAHSKYVLKAMNHFDSLLKIPNGAKLEEDINALANLETVALVFFEIERLEETWRCRRRK